MELDPLKKKKMVKGDGNRREGRRLSPKLEARGRSRNSAVPNPPLSSSSSGLDGLSEFPFSEFPRQEYGQWEGSISNPPLSLIADNDTGRILQSRLYFSYENEEQCQIFWGHPELLSMLRGRHLNYFFDCPRGRASCLSTRQAMESYVINSMNTDPTVVGGSYLCGHTIDKTGGPAIHISTWPHLGNMGKVALTSCLSKFVNGLPELWAGTSGTRARS